MYVFMYIIKQHSGIKNWNESGIKIKLPTVELDFENRLLGQQR